MKIRALQRHELDDIWSIDRTETIERMFRLVDGELVPRPERHHVRGWPEGEQERYGPILLDCFERGGAFYGAFEGERLVAVTVLESRFIGRDGDRLQLKFHYVGRGHRGRGLGRALFAKAVARARDLGARRLYVSATPSENTVRFYLGCGFRVTDDVDAHLFALEPEDIHMEYAIPV